jgi:hypothetical protein
LLLFWLWQVLKFSTFYCFSNWLWVVTSTITFIETLLSLGGDVLELTNLVLRNMFYISTFLGQSSNQWLALEHMIQG